jgi:Zn-dependent peptidase ImmA (M78 family)
MKIFSIQLLKWGSFMNYENLLRIANENNIVVKEKKLRANDGRIKENKIAIRSDMLTVQKTCVLAEELGHYYTTHGDILDQNDISNRKQERKARVWAYTNLVTLDRLCMAFLSGCRNQYEIAEYLEITEEFLYEAIEELKRIKGQYFIYDDFIIYFEPYLGILKRV